MLTGSQVQEIHRVAQLPADPLASFVAGSSTAGLATATSDVDVFLVVQEEAWAKSLGQVYLDGRRYDVEGISQATLDGYGDFVRDFQVSLDSMSLFASLDEHLPAITRFFYAQDISANPRLKQARAELRTQEAKLRWMAVGMHTFNAGNLAVDVVGNLMDGDSHQAFISSGNVALEACLALCAAGGELYGGAKFVVPKLRRLQLADGFWQTFESAVLSPVSSDLLSPTLDRLAFAQLVTAVAQLGELSWVDWHVRREGLGRSWLDWAVRVDDQVALGNSQRQAVVTLAGLRLWALANGASPEAVATTMTSSLSREEDTRAVRAEVDAYIAALIERDLLRKSARVVNREEAASGRRHQTNSPGPGPRF